MVQRLLREDARDREKGVQEEKRDLTRDLTPHGQRSAEEDEKGDRPQAHGERQLLHRRELVWGRSKWYVRQNVTGSFSWLHEKLLFNSLSPENLPPTLIQQYTRKCQEILRAYHENDDGCAAVANARKKYKSHRAVQLATHGNMLEHMPQ